MASSHVVAGEKLKTPLRRLPYQDEGGTWADTSNARALEAGENCRLLEVVDPVGEHSRGDDDEHHSRPLEEGAKVDAQGAAVDDPPERERARETEGGARDRCGG